MLCVILAVVLALSSVAALRLRHSARRREKARSMLADGLRTTAPPLPFLLALLGTSAGKAPSRLRRSLPPALIALAAYFLTHSFLLASLTLPAGLFMRRALDGYRRKRALAKKEEQVLEFIDSLTQSLRAGLSLRQSLQVSLEDVGGELGEEILGILQDVGMGNGLEECLVKAAESSPSSSLRLTFMVLGLLHGKGGDMPRILDRLRKRVAEGLEARREARILTSQSRASGYLVSSLPVVFLLLQAALNPRSLRPLVATPTGSLIIAVSALLNLAAFLLIRRMVDLEV